MIDLLELHKQFIKNHLKPGDTAVDFTMGNGHDTLFLSQCVGEQGHVFAFDIQNDALISTRKNLEQNNAPKNYTLICDSHHHVDKYIHSPIKAGMFNLGWLPSGDKSITTMSCTTIPAINLAIDLLDKDGILLIAIYPGHPEGDLEGRMVEELLASISKHKICATKIKIINSPNSPYFFLIETKP